MTDTIPEEVYSSQGPQATPASSNEIIDGNQAPTSVAAQQGQAKKCSEDDECSGDETQLED